MGALSEPVLEAIGRVFRLNSDQLEYVEHLADQADRRTPPRPQSASVRPQLQRLLDQLR